MFRVRRFINVYLILFSLMINTALPFTSANAYLDKKPIFYLWAKPGCYSANLKSSPTIPMYSIKKIYPVSCFAPHHFEVFYAGQFTTKDGRVGAGGREVVSDCLKNPRNLGFIQGPLTRITGAKMRKN